MKLDEGGVSMLSKLVAEAKAKLQELEAKLVEVEANVEVDVNKGAAALVVKAQAAKDELVKLLEDLQQKLN